NLGAVVRELARGDADPVLVCSGRERHFALEDATAAGLLALGVMEARPGEWELNDGARAAIALARDFGVTEDLLRATAGGGEIASAGLGEDIAFCAQLDVHDILPVLQDRSITLAPAVVGS